MKSDQTGPLRGCLAVLPLLLLAISCNKPPVSNPNVLSGEHNLNTQYTDTVTLITTTEYEDPVRTDIMPARGLNMLGSLNDPDFGASFANLYFQIGLTETNIRFGNPDSLFIDSIVLHLKYKGHYGDLMTDQTLKVIQLKQCIDTLGEYTSDTILQLGSQVGKKENYIPNVSDSIERIRLDDSFGQSFLSQSGTCTYEDDDNLSAFFSGFYLMSDTTQPGDAIMYVDMAAPESRVIMSYRKLIIDDFGQLEYVASTYEFRILSKTVINQYRHIFSNDVEMVIGDEEIGKEKVYVTSMAGLKTKVKMPYLGALGDIAINKAELVLSALPGENTFELPNQMLVIQPDTATDKNFFLPNSAISIVDQLEGEEYYGGSKDATNPDGVVRYSFNITHHFQAIIDGNIEKNYLYLLTFPGNEIADRVTLGGGNHPINPMQLRLTYTKID